LLEMMKLRPVIRSSGFGLFGGVVLLGVSWTLVCSLVAGRAAAAEPDVSLSRLFAAAERDLLIRAEGRRALLRYWRWRACFPELEIRFEWEHRRAEQERVRYGFSFRDGELVRLPPLRQWSERRQDNYALEFTLRWYPDEMLYPRQWMALDRKVLDLTRERLRRRNAIAEAYARRAALLAERERSTTSERVREIVGRELEIQELTALLDARTGGCFSAWLAEPAPEPRGGMETAGSAGATRAGAARGSAAKGAASKE
jgi:hypothetical protein